jgi:cytochrome P450
MTDIHVYIRGLHHNPDEWKEPEKFVPERFDPYSEWFLTPSGAKRHPMSFGPFLGGHRICLGKTFALSSLKRVLPIIIMLLDFEFVDKIVYTKKPPKNAHAGGVKLNAKVTFT